MPHSVLGLTVLDISVIISGIVTVFLARSRSKHIEMFGDLALHCLLHKTTPMTKTTRI